jgi:hypothetical protein
LQARAALAGKGPPVELRVAATRPDPAQQQGQQQQQQQQQQQGPTQLWHNMTQAQLVAAAEGAKGAAILRIK